MNPNDPQDTSARAALVKQYKDITHSDVPSGISSALLGALVAYETQAAWKGRLPARLRNQLRTIAQDAPIALSPSLRAGSRLVREWNGTSHTVDVAKDGFIYRERAYKSLSAIAREITGARWSGPRFFGLMSSR
jgi:hypothetical protein